MKTKPFSKRQIFLGKTCFILGVMPRSGTNYIAGLMAKHNDIRTAAPLYEDFITHNSDLLKKFTDKTYEMMLPIWKYDVEEKYGPSSYLLNSLGDGILQYLKRRFGLKNGTWDSKKLGNQNILLLKTPSVFNAENFYDIFPDQLLILIVRDGRSVVESGIKSFNWNFELSSRDWKSSSQTIKNVIRSRKNKKNKPLLVRYEDLVENTSKELMRIFKYLQIDTKSYDYASAENYTVVGSSEVKNKHGSWNWTSIKKPKNFSSIKRWQDWGKLKHERFNWIAGNELSFWGYSQVKSKNYRILWVLLNKSMDILWGIKIYSKKLFQNLKNLAKS